MVEVLLVTVIEIINVACMNEHTRACNCFNLNCWQKLIKKKISKLSLIWQQVVMKRVVVNERFELQ